MSAATPPPNRVPADRSQIRVGLPKVLNLWSTHRFWIGFLQALGVRPAHIVFSSDTSEEQFQRYGLGRGTVDCCHPVKSMSGHYGELLFAGKGIDLLLSPMIHSLPSFLRGHVIDNLACPRVTAAPENIKAGFLKEKDAFAERGVRHVSPFVSLAEPRQAAKQLHDSLRDILDLDRAETERAVEAGYTALRGFSDEMGAESRQILRRCKRRARPCVMILGRPYHMDPGIGHEIETALQSHGFPILWPQHFPTDPDLMEWLFGREIAAGRIRDPFDISDVWTSSYSANTNELLWAAKVATRCPWTTCAVHLSSYECGMDQPTYTPAQKIVEASGTLYFKFGDLDSTKPAGGVRIRVQTIAHYMRRHSAGLIQKKLSRLAGRCPL